MATLSLLSGEKLLIEGGGDSSNIWLTDRRVVYEYTTGFFSRRTETTALALENVESVESYFRRDPILVIIGLLLTAGGLYAASTSGIAGLVLLAIGVFFLVLFMTRRRAGGRIHGTRSTINFVVQGKARSEVDDFLREVQAAKARLADRH